MCADVPVELFAPWARTGRVPSGERGPAHDRLAHVLPVSVFGGGVGSGPVSGIQRGGHVEWSGG